jgi:hypothetical protein
VSRRLSDRVRRFLRRDIDSLETLEVLLHLRRAAGPCSVDAIVAELRSTPFAIGMRLEALRRRALVAADADADAWRYDARDGVEGVVAEVEVAYREMRLRVIDELYGEGEPMRAFADAFRLRSDNDEGER